MLACMPSMLGRCLTFGRDSYRVRLKTFKIGLTRAFYRLFFWTKKQKIIFLECTPCIALKVILQVFTRIQYLPHLSLNDHHRALVSPMAHR